MFDLFNLLIDTGSHWLMNKLIFAFVLKQGINDMILSFDYKGHKAEILTADAQFSYKDGVVVLVTGCLTGKDNVRRKFTQSFFLAPQDNGYFVLNDVFRYMDERESLMVETIAVNDVNENSPVAPLTPEPGLVCVSVCWGYCFIYYFI